MFKVGDRVRYIGPSFTHRDGVVTGEKCKREGFTYVEVSLEGIGSWPSLAHNLVLLRPLTPLEQDLSAYIASEKKELGLV